MQDDQSGWRPGRGAARPAPDRYGASCRCAAGRWCCSWALTRSAALACRDRRRHLWRLVPGVGATYVDDLVTYYAIAQQPTAIEASDEPRLAATRQCPHLAGLAVQSIADIDGMSG